MRVPFLINGVALVDARTDEWALARTPVGRTNASISIKVLLMDGRRGCLRRFTLRTVSLHRRHNMLLNSEWHAATTCIGTLARLN